MKAAHCETDCVTLFITATEGGAFLLSYRFKFSRSTHTQQEKGDIFEDVQSPSIPAKGVYGEAKKV
jgi:hypothetical protein